MDRRILLGILTILVGGTTGYYTHQNQQRRELEAQINEVEQHITQKALELEKLKKLNQKHERIKSKLQAMRAELQKRQAALEAERAPLESNLKDMISKEEREASTIVRGTLAAQRFAAQRRLCKINEEYRLIQEQSNALEEQARKALLPNEKAQELCSTLATTNEQLDLLRGNCYKLKSKIARLTQFT